MAILNCVKILEISLLRNIIDVFDNAVLIGALKLVEDQIIYRYYL